MSVNETGSDGSLQQRKITPDELTEGFGRLGLSDGDCVVMHVSLSKIGEVDGGAAMVLHRLMNVLGRSGTLLMPTFTSVTRHSSTHDNFTKTGCWCEGRESRHLPFIPDLQPDKEIGEIAHRLCSWPASQRSQHPAYSFVAVGKKSHGLVRGYSLTDPLQPLKTFLKEEPFVLTIGVDLSSVSAVHIAEESRLPWKFVKERALTVASSGLAWVDVMAPGCSQGYQALANHVSAKGVRRAEVGSAKAVLYPMKSLITSAEDLLYQDPMGLSCGRPECLSCNAAQGSNV